MSSGHRTMHLGHCTSRNLNERNPKDVSPTSDQLGAEREEQEQEKEKEHVQNLKRPPPLREGPNDKTAHSTPDSFTSVMLQCAAVIG